MLTERCAISSWKSWKVWEFKQKNKQQSDKGFGPWSLQSMYTTQKWVYTLLYNSVLCTTYTANDTTRVCIYSTSSNPRPGSVEFHPRIPMSSPYGSPGESNPDSGTGPDPFKGAEPPLSCRRHPQQSRPHKSWSQRSQRVPMTVG